MKYGNSSHSMTMHNDNQNMQLWASSFGMQSRCFQSRKQQSWWKVDVLEVTQHKYHKHCICIVLWNSCNWLKAFKKVCKNVSNMPWSCHPPVSDEDMCIVSMLVETDRNFMIHELAHDIVAAILQAADWFLCTINKLDSVNSNWKLPLR